MYYRKIGDIKQKDLKEDFDRYYSDFKSKAESLGLGKIKFVKEHGVVRVYAEIIEKE